MRKGKIPNNRKAIRVLNKKLLELWYFDFVIDSRKTFLALFTVLICFQIESFKLQRSGKLYGYVQSFVFYFNT